MNTQEKKQPSNEVIQAAKEAYNTAFSLLMSYNKGNRGGRTYYAHFLMRMNVQFCYFTPNGTPMPTAGVSITDRINLYINPDFFLSREPLEQMDILEHEVKHIIYMHPIRAKEYIGKQLNQNTAMVYNKAADANINQSLEYITRDFGVTIERLNEELSKKGAKERLDPNDPAEVHYEILMKNNMDDDEDGQGDEGGFDSHDTWAEGSTTSPELAKGLVKEAAEAAVKATGIGNMPTHLAKEILNMGKSVVNWQAQLRQFMANTIRFDRQRTRSRVNRRYGTLQAGRKKNYKLSIAACVDSSGSVCDNAFKQFFDELAAIAKQDVEITIIDADCGVAAVYEYKKGQAVKRYGNGGTAYQPAISKAMELEVDGIIYFGDMDSSDTPVNPKVPFLWAVVGSQNPPADFGKVIRITT